MGKEGGGGRESGLASRGILTCLLTVRLGGVVIGRGARWEGGGVDLFSRVHAGHFRHDDLSVWGHLGDAGVPDGNSRGEGKCLALSRARGGDIGDRSLLVPMMASA